MNAFDPLAPVEKKYDDPLGPSRPETELDKFQYTLMKQPLVDPWVHQAFKTPAGQLMPSLRLIPYYLYAYVQAVKARSEDLNPTLIKNAGFEHYGLRSQDFIPLVQLIAEPARKRFQEVQSRMSYETRKAEALAKLTPEEIELLGLNEKD